MATSLTFSEVLAETVGSPEPGALNFSALQRLLQAIIRKLGLENEAINQIQPDVPVEQPSTFEQERNESQRETQTVGPFEQSEEHQKLVENVDNLKETVDDLQSQVLEQKRISERILPTAAQLDRFHLTKSSSLHPEHDSSPDFLSLVARLDTIDETVGRLTALANDTVLEYSRMEKSLRPYLDGGELPIIRGQLDNINHLLKANFPGYRSHCSSMSVLRRPKPSTVDDMEPVDFYQHPTPTSVKAQMPRRSTIKHQPGTELEKELDAIRAVLMNLIARLPLADSDTDGSSIAASTHSLELGANSIRTVWPKEIEELLHSNHERIEALEGVQEKHGKQLDEIVKRVTNLDQAFELMSQTLETNREAIASRFLLLDETVEEKISSLDQRFDDERLETQTRLTELEHQVENRVDFEHFRSRLSRETFHQTIGGLQLQINERVEQFVNDLHLIWCQLEANSETMHKKCDREDLERLEVRFRHRTTQMQLLLNNLQGNLRHNVEAAGTKLRVGPESLRCVSCNHEATMKALAELIPTGKAFQTIEKERTQRIRELNKLVSKIAVEHRADEVPHFGKAERKTITKANMVPPNDLAYKVRHMKK